MLKKLVLVEEPTLWHLEQAINLDNIVYNDEFVCDYNNVEDWVKINPEIINYLVDEERDMLVAYYSAMPLTDEMFNALLTGEKSDTELLAKDILPYVEGVPIKLYFCSIVVHPEYQGTRAFTLLFNAFMNQIKSLYERGIIIEEVIAEGATDKGARLCRLSGLREVLVTNKGTRIYYSDNIAKDFRPTSSTSQEVQHIYKEEIGEKQTIGEE